MSEESRDNMERLFRHTPMRDVIRGRASGRLDVSSDLEALPESFQLLIGRVTRRTRLSRLERAEVIRDLAEHFREGLESGQGEEELLSAFGAEAEAARLIRRSMLRKRPAWARTRRRAIQGTLLVAASLVVAWLGWAYSISRRQPNVAVNYVERLNALNPSLAAEEAAWPHLRTTHLALRELMAHAPGETPIAALEQRLSRTVEIQRGRLPSWSAVALTPVNAPDWGRQDDDPTAEEIARFNANARPHIERLRELAGRETLGFPFTTALGEEDATFFGMHAGEEGQDIENFVVGVQLPYFTTLRMDARLLIADAEEAILAGETDRFLADVEAAFGLAGFARESRVTIGYLVAFAIQTVTFDIIKDAVAADPDAFTDAQLATLAGVLEGERDEDLKIDLTSERFMFDDFVQRVYSDDGNGDGVLLVNHAILSDFALNQPGMDQSGVSGAIAFLAAPAATFAYPSRKEAMHMYHTYMDRLQARFDQDVLPKMGVDSRVDGIDVLLEPQRAFPVSLLAPALDNAGRAALETRLKRDTAKLAVALERQRRSSGRWPANSLEVLAPQFIQAVPNCPFDGAPLRYALREGRPWVWSVGDDFSDDGAIDDITRMRTMDAPRRNAPARGEDLLLWIGPVVD